MFRQNKIFLDVFRGVDNVRRMDGRAAYPSISVSVHWYPSIGLRVLRRRRHRTYIRTYVHMRFEATVSINEFHSVLKAPS